MRKKYFSVLVAFSLLCSSAIGQIIPNFSFENWATDTNYLSLTFTNPVLLDTAVSSNPDYWTTSNSITMGSTLKHTLLVTQSATNHTGSLAMQLRSDSISTVIHNIPAIGQIALNFVCPGFAVCGDFKLDLSAIASLGSSFNPATIPGAGIPVTSRKRSIGGYLKYQPVGGDSAYIIAVLRKGAVVVAEATYIRYSTDANYTYFEAPFVYQNCLIPDTMVYTLSSGNPYTISNVVLGGGTNLHIGSTLLADSLFLSDSVLYSESYPRNDSASTPINTAVSIPVTTNDSSCDVRTFTLAQNAAPLHGSIVISGTNITYTPSNGFVGMDTFTYNESVGIGPVATARVVVNVTYHVGISEVTENKVRVYPNPASSRLQISTSNPNISRLRVIDMLGSEVKTESMSGSTALDVSSLDNGLYIIQFSSNDGKILTSSRFTVIK